MRYLIFILTFTFAGLNAQQEKVVSQEENTPEIVIYGDNGNQLNEGYIKNNKLHGYWAGFNKKDNTLSFGKYDQGEKVGKWYFWSEGNLRRVNYNNSILEE
jgi:antitoxin component YwqK of YwqJK toxin-antitoxin module